MRANASFLARRVFPDRMAGISVYGQAGNINWNEAYLVSSLFSSYILSTLLFVTPSTHSLTTLPPTMSAILETPSKVAASALANLDFSSEKSTKEPSLLSKMQAEAEQANGNKPVTAKSMNRGEGRVYAQIEMGDGRLEQHVSTVPRGKFVGDLSITDDSMEPLLQETEQRFVLFPIQYHDVSLCFLLACWCVGERARKRHHHAGNLNTKSTTSY